ncbi:unnamed protein product [Oikopleura dioica]|uniref:Uncharacterized protein n=1 Tax=Oikopleura dioica TaxID=34765 RepID=E4YWK0_OIKDI|nr:unnamed protein product [Oikopleura dioica]CBY39964.1 unnamed protein product [Oikopleura dioica]
MVFLRFPFCETLPKKFTIPLTFPPSQLHYLPIQIRERSAKDRAETRAKFVKGKETKTQVIG